MNWVLVLVMYGLLIFGVFMIESAARNINLMNPAQLAKYGSAGAYYAEMQKYWILFGSVVYFVTALVDYRWVRWLGLPAYLISLGLLFMAMVQKENVHRIDLFGFQFQPAYLGITSGILLIAWLVQDLPKLHRFFNAPMVRIGVIGVISMIPFFLVVKMEDMGSALVWLPVAVVALLVGGAPFRYLSFMTLIGAGFIPILYFIILPMVSERGPARIDTWLRMLQGQDVNTKGDAYGPYYVSMAVGKSGWKGSGWKSAGTLMDNGYIPKDTAHNDYIFGVIAEEQGFRGSLLLLSAFLLLLVQGLFVAFYSRDVSGRLIASLVVAMFFAHLFESIGMCVLLMPITGIPMPLVSYSGTFIVICMFMLGLVQSIWIHRNERLPSGSAETA
ncbi:FtsW/RodA/SpoVE family cell cycle protein [Luteolibacter pohnpeiensis]|uniref:FtsW/RodA/SpoVE family cell cycle protein n=1 Tax=Luteolibacter pohnpeiensis TaxID=454153 RepID=A0A934S635_9BACT|nr:FtsW/RodA/SpoVE family cell cycle protein [Luteolibacter pohnpeiensis]MBK1881446.1 FtsW/RodA/SpoVE family cell cycle protein [Luteolibacter pohnpeiensis]